MLSITDEAFDMGRYFLPIWQYFFHYSWKIMIPQKSLETNFIRKIRLFSIDLHRFQIDPTMPVYVIWMNFSTGGAYALGSPTTLEITLDFRIGLLHGKLPALGKSLCNCGCMVTRSSHVTNPQQLKKTFSRIDDGSVFDSQKETHELYQLCHKFLATFFPTHETLQFGRNGFCWSLEKVKFSKMFKDISDVIIAKLRQWTAQNLGRIRKENVPILLADDDVHRINEWIDTVTSQQPRRQSMRLRDVSKVDLSDFEASKADLSDFEASKSIPQS